MQQQKSVWPSAESAVAAIILADTYANARLHFMSRIGSVAMLVTAILMFGLYAIYNRPAQYRYILTDTQGIVVRQVPLDKPNQDDKFVIDWTTDATTRLYTFDYVNYRLQFQDAKQNMTIMGWDSFEKSMSESGNFNAVLGNRYVTTAAPTGPGRITKTGAIKVGRETRHAWKVEFPMVISYRSGKRGKDGKPLLSEQNLTMAVTVIRVPEYLNRAGMGIRAIVAE